MRLLKSASLDGAPRAPSLVLRTFGFARRMIRVASCRRHFQREESDKCRHCSSRCGPAAFDFVLFAAPVLVATCLGRMGVPSASFSHAGTRPARMYQIGRLQARPSMAGDCFHPVATPDSLPSRWKAVPAMSDGGVPRLAENSLETPS